MHNGLLKAFRTVRDFVFNLATATVGVTIAQNEIGPAFPTKTFAETYLKAVVLGIILAFFLGFIVYWKWRSRTAFWVWPIGLCTFVWRLASGSGDPNHPAEEVYAGTLVFVSVQSVSYSLGAFICSWWNKMREKRRQSSAGGPIL